MSWGDEADLSSAAREDGMIDGKALPNLPADSGFDYRNKKGVVSTWATGSSLKAGWTAR